MKCPKCGMNYEGSECPNCKVADILSRSDTFKQDSFNKKENIKLEKQVNCWRIAFYIFLMLTISFVIVYLLGIAVEDKMIQVISSIFSRSLFIVSIVCLLFYYLSDIRRQLILLNKKK